MDGFPEDRVQAALEELLAWPPIARSPQLAKFLSYIVTVKLKGEETGIKAYSIAVDVFGRPQSFDPQSDPIVRVQARRLRALLNQFYDEGHAQTGIRIDLPVGRYVPELRAIGAEPASEAAADQDETAIIEPVAAPASTPRPRTLRGRWLRDLALGFAGTVILGVVLYFSFRSAEPVAPTAPIQPEVLVGQFSNLTGLTALDGFGEQLSVGVRDDLQPFDDITSALADKGRLPTQPPGEGVYLVSGVIHPAGQGIEVTATLSGGGSDSIWNATYQLPVPSPTGGTEAADSLAHAIVREIGPFRGPVHMRGRVWLDSQSRPLPAINSYVCLLTYYVARETGNSSDIADALACLERLLRDQPNLPLALSATAYLEMRVAVNRMLPAGDLGQALEKPLAQAEEALQLSPRSLVYEHVGAIKNWQERFEASEQDYIEALELNPLNTDARAGYAITLFRNAKWELSGEQAARAIADTPYPSPWYFYPISINALRAGRYEEALETARRATRFGGGEIGTAIALVAANALSRKDVVDELLPRFMTMETLRRAGIMPWLSGQVRDPGLLAYLATALGKAGVPANALTAPF